LQTGTNFDIGLWDRTG